MNRNKYKYILSSLAASAIIYFAGGYQLPMYASRLIVLAILVFVDIMVWLQVRQYIARGNKTLRILYWLPLALLLSFFITGLVTPYVQWLPFFRIYIPGILMILLIGKGVFLIFSLSGLFVKGVSKIVPRFISKPQSRGEKKTEYGLVYGISALISGLVALIFLSGMIFWVHNFKLNKVDIELKQLPSEFDEYKIIQISDLHLGSYASSRPLKELILRVNAQKPDLILFTGDIVNFTTAETLPFEKLLKTLSAKDGIYAVLGNHDYGDYTQWNTQSAKDSNNLALFNFYQRIGWHLLRNQNTVIRRDSASIAVIGSENWSLTKRFGKKGDIAKALRGCENVPVKILMSHDPSHWDGEINTKYPEMDLTLSGHTHAFQIAVETGSIKWSPASILYTQWGGLYEKPKPGGKKQYLYVNRGVGTLGYPGRIFTRPEITLITLRNRNK